MYIKKPLLLESLILALVVLILHIIASELHLYWTTNWYDVMMHFLGGFLIAIIAGYIFFGSRFFHFTENKLNLFIVLILSVLVVGLAWELFEIFTGMTSVLRDLFDTLKDIVMDTLGAICGSYYSQSKLWKKEN